MNLAKEIIDHIEALPETKQIEVLDFVEYLRAKTTLQDKQQWFDFAITTAMRGLENEDISYSIEDLEESF